MAYSIANIAAIVGGTLSGPRHGDSIEHLLLDSRRLIFPGTSLFFALKGPRRSGDKFIAELYRRGVRNFVVSAQPAADLTDANFIEVDDPLAALQRLAAFHRMQFSLPVIGITGSNGKTTVKEWLNQLLEDRYHIVRSPKSYNSQTGVPLSVWQLQPVHGLAIFEAGISRRGEMRRLQPVVRPTIGLFTNIGEAHSEGFGSRAEKAAEKLNLFKDAEVLIYCNDQPETVSAIAGWDAKGNTRLFAWGSKPGAAMPIGRIEKRTAGQRSPDRQYPSPFPL
ncbi:Mur ligase family protein [Puia sp. P3]|uniref:Mur ligase family protein n=1 Tax=Puia sp. P3 TaxID=3423952 RepID=UPI003D666850